MYFCIPKNSYFIYNDKESIINQHCLLHSFCYFLGYLLNFIPTLISYIKTKEKEKPIINKLKEKNNNSIEYIYNNPNEKYLSIKDILKFFLICNILLLADLIENTQNIIDTYYNGDDKRYDDDFIFIKFLIIFLVSKFDNEVYYKHQNISFIILILLEVIKNIYFFFKKLYHAS